MGIGDIVSTHIILSFAFDMDMGLRNKNRLKSSDHLFIWSVATLLVVVLYLCIHFVSTHGEESVNALDERVGTVLAGRAEILERAGLRDEAIAKYEEALAVEFHDPQQRVYTTHRLARLLIDSSAPEDAVAHLKTALQIDNTNNRSHSLLGDALADADRPVELLKAAQKWFAVSSNRNDTGGMRWAKYQEGRAFRDLGDKFSAVEAFKASFEIAPSVQAAYQITMLSESLGSKSQAREYARYVLEFGKADSDSYRAAEAVLHRN